MFLSSGEWWGTVHADDARETALKLAGTQIRNDDAYEAYQEVAASHGRFGGHPVAFGQAMNRLGAQRRKRFLQFPPADSQESR
jgi:hypothetical protein